ncbi:efflux RND transporter permease subunit, partial [candidate division WOR-3 bacterium]|nr:efflux RND transporter permease subunit [candidate division WOR-3 bacterium]
MINWFLKRPVSLICIYAIIMVMGIVSLFRLPVELYPDVEFPSLSIRFYWSGASAEAVERYITRKVEAGVYKLNGVKNVESTSERGECSIDVDFERETDVAYQRVLLSEELLREKFPYGVKGPYFSEKIPEEIKRGEPFVLYITGPYSIKDIGEYARRLKIFLSRVDGIKDINIYGNVEEIIKIKITNELFKPVELVRKLQEKRIAGGSVELEGREISVTCVPYQKINDIRIRGIPINKIADIQYVYKEPAVLSRINGNPQISLNISKRPGSNILKMSKDIRKIINIFPMKNGMKIIVARDEADIIRDTMRKIMLLGIISIFGVGIALFLFFKKIYNVVVFTLSIIFSTLLTFSLLYFSKLSLNALTLSGIALGFGMLVDNSIIVLENIMRMKEIKEKNPEFKGASDVFIAVLASTITTISVYIPFLY